MGVDFHNVIYGRCPRRGLKPNPVQRHAPQPINELGKISEFRDEGGGWHWQLG